MSPDGFRDDIWQQVCNIMNARDGLELVPAQLHKLNDAGSNPAPASNEVNAYDMETESERYEGIRQSNACKDRGRDE